MKKYIVANNNENNEEDKDMENQIIAINSENSDYNIQQLMNMIGNNASITGQIGLNVQNMNKQMGIMASQMNGLMDDMSSVKGDIESLKLNEEVTTTQQETITESAQKRISEILNHNTYEKAKYFRTFIKRLYRDARQSAGLGSKISRTKKGNFQRVIDYIEAWTPKSGCAELKAEIDKKAEVKRQVKELGYVD